MLQAPRLIVHLVGLIAVAAAACGTPWYANARVESARPGRVCVASDGGEHLPQRLCFDPRDFALPSVAPGDCLRLKHKGESGRLVEAKVVACRQAE
jgi:hypothetical protein